MKMTVFTDHLRLKGLFSNEFYEMKMTLMNPCLTLEPSLITMFIEALPGKPNNVSNIYGCIYRGFDDSIPQQQ